MADTAPTPTPVEDRGTPLAGHSVLVTRTREQAHSLVDPLEALGAEVLAMPVLETIDPEDWHPVDEAIDVVGSYDWIIFTSTNGVDHFLSRFRARHGDYDALVSTCMAAVGSATAHRLRAAGFPPDLVPEDFRAEGLVAAFRELDATKCRRVLIPRAEEAREILPDALREMGCDVDVVVVYRTAPAKPDPAVIARLRAKSVDVATFTSGAMARAFLDMIAAEGLDPHSVMDSMLVASIGPITTSALAELGYDEDIEAADSTMPSLVDAVVAAYEPPGSSPVTGSNEGQ
jgi:uroporphyrinogen III methyltransferase/synthase